MFPLFDKKINRYCEDWKLYLLLRRIVEFAYSFKVKRIDLDQFHSDILNFLEMYSKSSTFSGQTFTYKLHHLTHYKQSFERYGPLIYLATLRFERVHQKLKNFVRSSKNRKNVPLSMAKAYINHLATQKDERNEIELENDRERELEFDEVKINVESECLKFLDNKKTKLLNRCLVENTELQIGNVYFWKVVDDFPLFLFIHRMFKQEGRLIILCKLIKTRSFDLNNWTYEVEMLDDLIEFKFKIFFKPLIFYLSDRQYHVVKSFYIPFEFCQYLFD